MRDITLNDKDKEGYVSNIEVNDNNEIIVHYASGKVENCGLFSQHNFEFYLGRMEKQFYEYKDSFLDYEGKLCLQLYAKRIISGIMALLSIWFSYNIDIHVLMKIFLFILIIITSFLNEVYLKSKLIVEDMKIGNVDAMDYFLKHKDEFKMSVIDEIDGEKKDIYVINMNNIDIFSSPDKMKDYVSLIANEDEEVTKFELKRG